MKIPANPPSLRRHTLGGTDIPGVLADYATVKPGDGPYAGREYDIDEDKLAAALPEGFLPGSVRRVLLGIDDTAQSGLTVFHDWGKYFDSYMLWLRTPESLDEEPHHDRRLHSRRGHQGRGARPLREQR